MDTLPGLGIAVLAAESIKPSTEKMSVGTVDGMTDSRTDMMEVVTTVMSLDNAASVFL